MKKNISNILSYIAIFVSIIMFIVVVYYIINGKKETYVGYNDIIVSSDFYDIADSDGQFIFADKGVSTSKKVNDSITVSNLCIYNADKQDMECITSGELGIVDTLPPMRYETVCIDEECLNLEDIKILTGKHSFKLSHNNKPLDGNNCLGSRKVNAQTCLPEKIDNFNSLGITECRSGNGKFNSNFVFEPSNLTKDEIGKIITNPEDVVVSDDNIAQADSGSIAPQHIVDSNYIKIGAYWDRWDRALNGGPPKHGYTIEACSNLARAAGMPFFALQNGNGTTGWCSITDNEDEAKQYGKNDNCSNATGCFWTNMLYKNL